MTCTMPIQSNNQIYFNNDQSPFHIDVNKMGPLCEDILLIIFNLIAKSGHLRSVRNFALVCQSWSFYVSNHHIREIAFTSTKSWLKAVGQISITAKGIFPANLRNPALIHACRLNKVPLVEFILKDKSIEPDGNFNDAIDTACKNGHVETVNYLLTLPKVSSTINKRLLLISAPSQNYINISNCILAQPQMNLPGIVILFLRVINLVQCLFNYFAIINNKNS